MRFSWICAAATLGLAGCGDTVEDGGSGDQVTALFELPSAGTTSEFYALPFPNDLRLDADGSVSLKGHPRPTPGTLETWMDVFDAKTFGFGTNSAIFMRFSGPIDAASLPVDAAASMTEAAAVYLVDVDKASPGYGKKMPIRMKFQEAEGKAIGPNWLSCLPYPGFPLRGKTKYALVATSRMKGKNGMPVTNSSAFKRVLARADAAAVYAPLLDWLDEPGGDDADDVVNATVFTTQDPVSLMGKMRKVIRDGEFSRAKDIVEKSNGGDNYLTFEGSYDTPYFQTGEVPYLRSGGEIVVDGNGNPIVQARMPIRFVLTVPRGEQPDNGWPIVLYAHGTGGDYRSPVRDGTTRRMAEEGLAVISIDMVLHGPRDPTGSQPELTFFNFMNAVAGRDNVRQGAADLFQLTWLVDTLQVKSGDVTHGFNGDKIMFMGHSQGGLHGPLFLAFEPKIKAAVLSGAGALIYVALLYKLKPVSIPDLLQLVVRDDTIDEFNPLLSLVQMFIEPADPVNYGPLITTNVYQSEGFVDTYAPIKGIEALGVSMGLSPVGPIIEAVPGFAMRGQTVLTAPVMNNLGGRTGVFLQYMAPSGDDGHYVATHVETARRQHVKFLSTAAQGTATLVP